MTGGTKKVGSAGRFSTRYGVKTRTQIAQIEAKQRALHPCPRCGQVRVKRLGTGIWKCRRCLCVFAGGAYMPRAVPKQVLGAEMAEGAPVEKKKEAKPAKKAPKKEKRALREKAPAGAAEEAPRTAKKKVKEEA